METSCHACIGRWWKVETDATSHAEKVWKNVNMKLSNVFLAQFALNLCPSSKQLLIKIIEGVPVTRAYNKYGYRHDVWSRSESVEIWRADSSYMKTMSLCFLSPSREESLETLAWNSSPLPPQTWRKVKKRKKNLLCCTVQVACCWAQSAYFSRIQIPHCLGRERGRTPSIMVIPQNDFLPIRTPLVRNGQRLGCSGINTTSCTKPVLCTLRNISLHSHICLGSYYQQQVLWPVSKRAKHVSHMPSTSFTSENQ